MTLKSKALQGLFEEFVNYDQSKKPSPIIAMYEMFNRCDEELARETERLKKNLEVAVKETEKLRREVSQKDKRICELQKQLLNVIPDHDVERAKKEIDWLRKSRLEWAKRAVDRRKERDEAREKCDKLEADCKATLELNDKILKQNTEFVDKLQAATDARDHLRAELEAKVKRLDEITKDRDYFFKRYHALMDDYDKLEAKYRELKKHPDHYAEGYSDGKEEGEENLWNMLQNVRDTQPNEFDPECECLGDVIDMDLEDFLDVYKKWQEENKRTCEQNETERMRKWLDDFCFGRECKGCPLESKEYKCGYGYSFSRRDRFDLRIIPDEDIKRYYEKAHSCDVREKIKDACDALYDGIKDGLASEVKEVPVTCDIPIKDLESWECTIEVTVEVNKDLLEKVCGVKTDNDEEAHKLEYGDAVRVPWRNYDYMYIGPEDRHIRIFNPKTHTVVFVSPTEKLTYQGCKIILTSEEDLRKIWKS